MTIMLKNGKEKLKNDILNGIGIGVKHNIEYGLNYRVLQGYKIYLNSSNGISLEMDKVLLKFTEELMQQISNTLCQILDQHIYTQEEMEKDLGLHK